LPEPTLAAYRRTGPRIVESLFIAAIATSSLVSVRLATVVTVTDGLLLACGVLAALRLLATGTLDLSARRIPMPVAWVACVGLVTLGGLLSSIRAVDPPASISITLRLLVVTGLLPLLAWLLMRREGDLVKAAAALAMAGAFQGLAAMLQLTGLESTLFGSPQFGRYTGFAGHPNDLGAALAITLPMSLVSLFLFAKRRFTFVLLGLGFILTIVGLRLSGSLSAIAGAVAGVVVTLLVLRKGGRASKRWIWYGVGIAALILILLVRYGASLEAGGRFAEVKDPRTRLSEVVGGRGTLSTRFRTIRSAIEDIAENPLVGRGFDRESTGVFHGHQVHSMPILAWHAGGLLVLTGLFGLIFLSLRIARPGRSATSWKLRVIRAGLLGSTCAMIVNGLAQPFLYKRFGWIPVALIFSRPILQKAAPSANPKVSGPPGEPDPAAVPDRLYAINGRSGSG
jgi:hypothetical protein